jgi:hypothetical protein
MSRHDIMHRILSSFQIYRRRGRGELMRRTWPLALEQLEDRRLLSAGATVPWTRYEAESGVQQLAGRLISVRSGEAKQRRLICPTEYNLS